MSIETLYQSALQGDSAAEKTLFQQLSVRFGLICQHRIWNKEDAEEIVQEALVTVLGGFKDIEIERSFAAWAHKVLDNKILTYLKTKKARISRQGEADLEALPDRDNPADPRVKVALLHCLQEVGRANSRYARALNFHYQGYSTAEICQRLKMNPGHFYVLLMRARAMLAECLGSRSGL